jgi:subtilisin family serine protease
VRLAGAVAAACIAWSACAGALWADAQIPDAMPCRIVDMQTGQVVSLADVPASSSGLSAIGVPAMLSKYPFIDGTGQTIAIIDTGIDYTHPALAGRYLGGYDFADHDSDPMDTFGHGTHVAGIVASTDATYRGVAPGANIIALKVFADGSGTAYDSDIISALWWVELNAAKYNITAVNISLGGDEQWKHSDVNPDFWSEYIFHDLKDMGIFVACASGNDGYLHGVSYPAASPYTVSVGGTWANDDYKNYIVYWDDKQQWNPGQGMVPSRMADYGPQQDNILVLTNRYSTADDGQLDLLAPAALITSTYPMSLDTYDGSQDGFTDLLGTSMATPYAAGASVLVRQALQLAGKLDPNTANQVDQILGILQDNGKSLNDWYVALMEEAGLGDHRNLVQSPTTGDFYDNWYFRMGTDASYSLIDLDAAISSINPTPEPGTVLLLWLGAATLLRRRRGA